MATLQHLGQTILFGCLGAVPGAGRPEVFNTDQGAQFTAKAFTSCLEGAGIRVSMDGRGRRLDNVFVERLWRSVKYDDIYLQKYARVPKLEKGLEHYFAFYNYERPHQELTYQVPAEVYLGSFDSLLFTQEVSPIWVGLWS